MLDNACEIAETKDGYANLWMKTPVFDLVGRVSKHNESYLYLCINFEHFRVIVGALYDSSGQWNDYSNGPDHSVQCLLTGGPN